MDRRKVSPIRALSEKDFANPPPPPKSHSPFAPRNPSPLSVGVRPFAGAAVAHKASPLRAEVPSTRNQLSPIRKALYGAAKPPIQQRGAAPPPAAPPRSPLRNASPIVRGDQQLRTKYWVGSGFLTPTKLLGKGTFGEAWLAQVDHNSPSISPTHVRHFPSQVVLKVTPQQHYEVYALKEMELLRQLRHPNVVQLVDCWVEGSGEYRGKLIIAMEYCACGDLADLIRDQRDVHKHYFRTEFVESLALQLASAIHGCHSKHIIHRDIKPANIFLTRRPSPTNEDGDVCLVLGDFGVSKNLESTLAPASTMVGTPYYLCPEQVSGQPYNVKGDVWALGVVLFELMTLKRPFKFIKTSRGGKHDFDDLYRSIQFDDPTPILDKVAYLYAPWLRDLTVACLRKRPSDRPSAASILTDFSPAVSDAVRRHRIFTVDEPQIISKPSDEPSSPHGKRRASPIALAPERGSSRSPIVKSPPSEAPPSQAKKQDGAASPPPPSSRKSPSSQAMDRYMDPNANPPPNSNTTSSSAPRPKSKKSDHVMHTPPAAHHPNATNQASMQFAAMNQRIKAVSNAIDDTLVISASGLSSGRHSDSHPSSNSSSHSSFAVTFTDPYSGAQGESILVNNAVLLDAVGGDEELFLIVKVMILTRTRMSADQMRSAVSAVVGVLRPSLPTGPLMKALRDDASLSSTG